MLPAAARLRRSADFTATVRRGRRGRSGLLIVHLLAPAATDDAPRRLPPTCGFVVSKAVGGSVVRHRVLRKLRHLMSARLESLPVGSQLVVRALPAAATAPSTALATELDRSLRAALGRAPHREQPETAARP